MSQVQKAENRALARRRVVIEKVNRCLKIFRILAERYRNRRRRFGLRCNLIAALCTLQLRTLLGSLSYLICQRSIEAVAGVWGVHQP